MRTRGRISRRSHGELERDGCSVPVLVILASVIIALAFPALILSPSLSDSSSESSPSHHSVMVLRFSCVACQCCPTAAYFTTCQAAAVHYARSVACHQSLRGIAVVVLPSRPADAEAGGSGAAGGWAGPSKLTGGTMARPRPSMTGASVHIVYYLLIFILCPGSYTISYSLFTIS